MLLFSLYIKVIHLHTHILFQILFPYRLLENIKNSSLCYTVGPCWLSILYLVVGMNWVGMSISLDNNFFFCSNNTELFDLLMTLVNLILYPVWVQVSRRTFQFMIFVKGLSTVSQEIRRTRKRDNCQGLLFSLSSSPLLLVICFGLH